MKSLMARVAQGEVLISDGAMGTFLHAKGLGPGECPESWCISHPDVLKGIAEAYIAAGSDIIETNSFGGSSLKLQAYGLGNKVRELNRAAAMLAKEAMGERGYVAASVGPTGHFAKEEYGDVSTEELYEAFLGQVTALAEGGADAICVETMSSIVEAVQAIKAAKENTKLPVICTFTFDQKPRGLFTIMGVTPEQAAEKAASAGADIVGANCGNGISNMVQIAKRMREVLPKIPILIQANAGMPKVEDGKTVFQETPEYMAFQVKELIEAGANIIGGCCGTTPDHIAAMAKASRVMLKAT